MSNIVDEKKKMYTTGMYNAIIELDGTPIEALSVEAKTPQAAFQKIIRYFPVHRSKYVDDKLGWDETFDLIEEVVDHSYEVEFDSTQNPLALGRYEVEFPLKESDLFRTLRATFYARETVL